jgi:large subunit ribosomal protein L4
METTLYNQTGAPNGKIKLSDKVFGVKWNADLVHQVAVSMMANARAGTAHTKDRGEVAGGGKKPWKQKGTGRARHGSTRSPIWVGGGITFGPRSDKDYSKKINKKMRVKALFTVLSRRAKDGQIIALDTIAFAAPKTKEAAALMQSLAKNDGLKGLASKKKTAALIVMPEIAETTARAFANLPGVTLTSARELSVLDVMKFNTIVLMDAAQVGAQLEAKMQ